MQFSGENVNVIGERLAMNQEGRNHISLFVAKEILSADKHKKPLITTSELDIKNACLPLKVSTRSTADNKKKKATKAYHHHMNFDGAMAMRTNQMLLKRSSST